MSSIQNRPPPAYRPEDRLGRNIGGAASSWASVGNVGIGISCVALLLHLSTWTREHRLPIVDEVLTSTTAQSSSVR